MPAFTDLPLAEPLQQALREVGYSGMTAVQAASLPAVLAGEDVIVQAQTGSGKTAVYALGLLSGLDVTTFAVQGVVLCPTRELADQISREIRRLGSAVPNVKVLTLCGGIPVRVHLASLAVAPHLIVGTPGRILDLMRRQALPFKDVVSLVLDEADRMLDMGFAADLEEIIAAMPVKRQTLLFSATIPPAIRTLSRQYQQSPQEITPEEARLRIEQIFFAVEPGRKLEGLVGLLAVHAPTSAVVFCNTRDAVRETTARLNSQGFSALALHGELEQRAREEMLVCFANHSTQVLVATDVAARGLDIAGLSMVVNFDLANDADTHLHRIGRTGRAGRPGLALSLCTPSEKLRSARMFDGMPSPPSWQPFPKLDRRVEPSLAPFATVIIDAGRQDKLRPGDVLGALTGDVGLPVDAVGKIDIFPTRTYVAIAFDWYARALQRLKTAKIKGRTFRVRTLNPPSAQ